MPEIRVSLRSDFYSVHDIRYCGWADPYYGLDFGGGFWVPFCLSLYAFPSKGYVGFWGFSFESIHLRL